MANKSKKEEMETPKPAEPNNTTEAMQKLLAKVEELERKDAENEKKLKMLYEVADKGRVFNYENSRAEKKPFKIKLSKFADGLIIGWSTIKDELVKNPTTGLTVGENQEYEIKILASDGSIKTARITSYSAFSNARYSERIECEVVGKGEDYEGRITYTVVLPDGRNISLPSQFVN